MRHLISLVFTRHEPVRGFGEHAKSALGAALAILLVGWLGEFSGLPLLVAPLGASVVIVFGYPGAALAQPLNVFGAYLLTTVIGVIAAELLPHDWWVVAPVVGLGLFAMQTLRVTHPPAGAIPIVTLTSAGEHTMLFVTLLLACVGMVGMAVAFHALPPRRRYPAPHPGLPVQHRT